MPSQPFNVRMDIGKLRVGTRGRRLKSAAEIVDTFNEVIQQIEDVSPAIISNALAPTLELAQYYCPKKTGALVNSSYSEITQTGRQCRVEIGFAKGGEPPYAVFVHEMTEYYHESPTRSKFLQAAVVETLPSIMDRLEGGYTGFMGL